MKESWTRSFIERIPPASRKGVAQKLRALTNFAIVRFARQSQVHPVAAVRF